MSKSDFAFWLEIFFRRRATIRRILTAVVVPAAVMLLIWPPVYESTAKILVQSNQAQLMVSPGVQQEGTMGSISSVPVTEQDLNSEAELLTSPYLIKWAIVGAGVTPKEKGPLKALNAAVAGAKKTVFMSLINIRGTVRTDSSISA
jgi:hypothetical protein